MTYNEFLGEKIVDLFKLSKLREQSKKYGKNWYSTAWGNKTYEGIGACVERLRYEALEQHNTRKDI